ncbi:MULTISPECIES: hypothetical protein [unclassified Pseudomonas]|uniref:hypothetical protein n=1 Tax=unclassified Pseudomonas TaxID=196821 RepID=UPI00215784C9|nr:MULTISPECIES: hypothetical protein [unclassified Pseudomonas]
MSEVKRFDHVNHAHVDDCEHIENPEGAWVKASDYDALAAEAQALREEVAALRARVVVLPDASTVYAALDARERLFTSPENIQVALEAQSRITGLTVSEGLLRRVTADPDYEEVFTMARGEALTELLDLLNQDKENGDRAA